MGIGAAAAAGAVDVGLATPVFAGFGADAALAAGATLSTAAPSLATAATIGSSLISGVGAISQSRASAASAGYNAKVAAQNAQLQTQNAAFAGSQGEQEIGAEGAKTKAAIAATLANQGASGVDVNTGSSVNVRESEAKLGMLNALTIRSNAAKQAYGYQVGSASEMAQSNLLRSQQQSDTTGGYISAGADILGGVGNAAKYTTYLNGSSPIGTF